MKRLLIIFSALSLFAVLNVGAQINAVDNAGYMARAKAMFTDENFVGCIDQLSHINRESLTSECREEADWLLAQSAYRTGEYRASMSYFRGFLATYPESPRRMQALKRIGDCLFGAGNYERALKVYQRVDSGALTSDLAETMAYRIAYCKLQLGDYAGARQGFESLSRNSVWGNASRFYLGYLDYQQRDYDKALANFRTVNTSSMPGMMADYYLSQIYFLKGEYGKAISTARALLRRDGNLVEPSYLNETRRVLGESLYRTGQRAEGLEYLRKYLADTDTPELTALYIVGVDEYDKGNYSEAVELLQPVSASLYDSANEAMAQSAYLYIGQALYRDGNKDGALLAFDAALKSDADKAVKEAAYYNYAVAKFSGGNIPFGSSVATFEDFLNKYPSGQYSESVQEYLVNGYLADDDLEKSLAGLNRIPQPSAKVQKAKQQVLYRLGAKAVSARDLDKASNYLAKAEELSRYDSRTAAETSLLIGEVEMLKGNHGSAAERFSQYLSLGGQQAPNRDYALYSLGYAEFGLKKYEDAKKSFISVLELTDDNELKADILNRLGDISYYASNFKDAEEYYKKSYALIPESGDYALFQQALMSGYSRDYKTKENLLEQFRAKYPQSTLMPDALLEETEALLHLNKPARAVSLYEILTQDYASTSQGRQGYLQMALTLLNMGKKNEGVAAYKEVIRRYPTSEEAVQAANFLKNIYMNDGRAEEFLAFMESVEGAPVPDAAEVEIMTFEAAEKDLTVNGKTVRMEKYVAEYPGGTRVARAYELLMEAAEQSGNRPKSYEYAKTIVARFPNHSSAEKALIIKAQEEYNLGRGNAALASWEELEKKASTPERVNTARVGIMRIALDLGDTERVLAVTETILATSTIDADTKSEATFVRAIALNEAGKTAEARKLWKSLSSKTDNLYGAKSAYYLGESQYEAKEYDAAMKTAQALTSSGTPHKYWLARGFILMSDIFAAQGKEFEAKEYLRALKENYPGSESDIFEMIDSRLKK